MNNATLESFLLYQKIKFRIKRNRNIYYLSKIPLLNKFLPDYPYRSNEARSLGYVLLGVTQILLLAFMNILFLTGVMFISSVTLLKAPINAKYILSALLYFIIGLLTVLDWTSYVRTSPEEYGVFLNELKVDANVLARNIHIEGLVFGVFNNLFLFLILKNKFFAVLILLAWVAGLGIGDSLYIAYFKKYQKPFLREKSKWFYNGIIRVGMVLMNLVPFALLALYSPFWKMSNLLFVLIVLSVFLGSQALRCHVLPDADWETLFREKQILFNDMLVKFGATEEIMKKSDTKHLSQDFDEHIKGTGFVKLNNIFFRRFSKVWRRRFWLNLFIIGSGAIIIVLIQSDLQNELSQLQGNLTGILGIILLGSYYLNFGNKITMALFTHCDQSLLGYRTYNSGRNVLLNFIQRLYHVIRLHIPQILILSITAVFLTLMISPDVDRLSMFLVFAAFVSAGIAFCIHSLVLYYLFQPYNSELAVKSVGFTVADMLTYFAVYSISNFQGEHLTLLKIITSSALIYFVVASLLIYFLAPKTFKIRK